jgi:hypothetical protein
MSHRPSSWRPVVRPFIRRVLMENLGADDKTLRKALRKAYPFVLKSGWKYQVWLDEIKVQERELGRWLRWADAQHAVEDPAMLAWLKGSE